MKLCVRNYEGIKDLSHYSYCMLLMTGVCFPPQFNDPWNDQRLKCVWLDVQSRHAGLLLSSCNLRLVQLSAKSCAIRSNKHPRKMRMAALQCKNYPQFSHIVIKGKHKSFHCSVMLIMTAGQVLLNACGELWCGGCSAFQKIMNTPKYEERHLFKAACMESKVCHNVGC